MKKIYKKLILSILVFSTFVILVSNSGGYTSAGATGAPGEQTCARSGCHGNLNSGAGSVNLSIMGNPSEYIPGQTYNLTILVLGSSVNRYGFQISARNTSNNSAGTLVAAAGNQLFTNGGRQYLTHTSGNTSGTFNFTWTAPTSGTGAVTFFYTGNAAENPGGTGGDFIYSASSGLSELIVAAPISSFTALPVSVCAGNSITYSNTSSGNIDTYNWSFGTEANPPTASGAGPHIVTYNSAGNFTSSLKVVGAGGSDSTTQNIQINPNYSITNNTTSCQPGDVGTFVSNLSSQFGCDSTYTSVVTLSNINSENFSETACDSILYNGNWFFETTSFNDTIENGATNGCDSVTIVSLTVNNINIGNFNETACDSILYNGNWFFETTNFNDTIENGASNGCDSVTIISLTVNNCSVNIKNVLSNHFHIFPNPTSNFLNINNIKNTDATLEIFSIDGKIVKSINISNNTNSIDLSRFLKGFYVLKFTSKSEIFTTKILVN